MRFVINTREYWLLALLLFTSIAAMSGCGGQPAADVPPPAAAPAVPPPAPIAASPKPRPATSAAPAPAVSHFGNFAAALAQFDEETADQDPAGKSSAAKAPDKPSPAKQPISDAEAKEFVSAFDKALRAGDAKALEQALDEEAMIRKAVTGLGLPQETGESFIRGSVQRAAQGQGEAAQFASRVTQGGKYYLLHVHKQGNWQCALYRFFDEKDHMNYLDFILARDETGKVRINDYYDYGFAELNTMELMRAIMCQLVEERAETAEKNPAIAEYAKHKDEIESMEHLIYDKKYGEAIAIYDKLPDSLQKSRIGLILRVSACHKEKDKCDDLVRLFREKFPDDSGLDLFIGGYHTALRRWDKALAGIDVLDKQLGGDPYLDARRADIQLLKGNLSAAKKLLQKSVAAGAESHLIREVQKEVDDFEKSMGGATSAAEEAPGKPAGDDEAKTFAEQLVKCVMSGDDKGVQMCIDVGSFYRKATAKIDVPAEIKLGLEASFRSGSGAHIADYFHLENDQIEKGATFSLLRLHARKGEQHAVFRHIYADDGLAYCDCILEQHADGKVRIADYYDLNAGCMRTETFSLLLSGQVKDYQPSSDDSPPSQQTKDPNAPPTLGAAWHEMQERVNQTRYQEAFEYYSKLPGELQKEKRLMLARVHAAIHLTGEPYDSALGDYRAAFPKEPNVDLLTYEVEWAKKHYDRALASIDRLDHTIGGDPFLDVLRCEIRWEKKDVNGARRLARKAVDADPHIYRAYKWLLTISLKQKKFVETSTVLTAVQKHFPHCLPDVKTDPEYADYLKSAQYKAWTKKQKTKG